MNLVIAEKPSVGAALAKALGAREKKKRYKLDRLTDEDFAEFDFDDEFGDV